MASTSTEAEVSQQVVEKPQFVADPSKHAFVTLVFSGDNYVSVALVLAHSIKAQGSKASLVVLVSSDVSSEARVALKELYDEVIEVPVINVKIPTKSRGDAKVDGRNAFSRFAFTKLHALNLTQFNKIALLDADQLCTSNPDSIFEYDVPSGICTSVKNDKYDRQAIPQDIKDKCYRDNGICGAVYVLRPSTRDFERAISMLTVKVKVTQVQVVKKSAMSVFNQKKSLFSLLDDDEDEDDEDEDAENDEDGEQQSNKSKKSVKHDEDEPERRVVTKTLTPEEIESSMFEDDKRKKEKFPFTTYQLPSAPLGFAYGEGKKTSMGYDEAFIFDLYRSSWKHLSSQYAILSWKKPRVPPVFLHYTEQPWTRQKDWDDFAAWDLCALEMIDQRPALKNVMETIVPVLQTKREARDKGELAVKAPEPEVKPAVTPSVEETPETPAPAPRAVISVPAPLPEEKAWVGPRPAALQPKVVADPSASLATTTSTTTTTTTDETKTREFPEFIPASLKAKK